LFFTFRDSEDLGSKRFASKDVRNLFKIDPAKLSSYSAIHKKKELKF